MSYGNLLDEAVKHESCREMRAKLGSVVRSVVAHHAKATERQSHEIIDSLDLLDGQSPKFIGMQLPTGAWKVGSLELLPRLADEGSQLDAHDGTSAKSEDRKMGIAIVLNACLVDKYS